MTKIYPAISLDKVINVVFTYSLTDISLNEEKALNKL